MREKLKNLLIRVAGLISSQKVQQVTFSESAQLLADNYSDKCDRNIRKTKDDSYRQIWNRAHLKTLRVAGVLAVADNPINPVVQVKHYEYALLLVKKDTDNIVTQLQAGTIGDDDNAREKRLLGILAEYISNTNLSNSFKINKRMQQTSVISLTYLRLRLLSIAQFSKYPRGANEAIRLTLQPLLDTGRIAEVNAKLMNETYKNSSKGRAISKGYKIFDVE